MVIKPRWCLGVGERDRAESRATYAVRPAAHTDTLRPTYAQELEALGQTYADVLAWEAAPLEKVVARLGAGPASFIASGGMLTVATLAAQLHERACLEPGEAMTPLVAISRPPLTAVGAMLFTSSGKHSDAHEVMQRLGRPGMRPAAVLTHRSAESLPAQDAAVVTLPSLPLREGFLAVNSVLSMTVALVRTYLGDFLPSQLCTPGRVDAIPDDVDRLLVLHPPLLAAAASDIETRLAEIGLAAVQVVDYRNFAHGRHTGLERNAERTAVLVLSDGESRPLADATVAALPAHLRAARWHADTKWPESALQLIVTSMNACGTLGARSGVDVGRPKVPAFGRRLYHLPVRRRLPDVLAGPVQRKLGGLGGSVAGNAKRVYVDALERWSRELAERRFAAVVLDYDGTVCATERRFAPPQPDMVAALDSLLGRGLRLGFASGRGPSLQRDLRKVLDREHWPRVELGLYNGGVLCRLDEDLGDLKRPTPIIAAAHARLRDLPFAEALELEPRCAQLTVGLRPGAWMKTGLLAEIAGDALRRSPALPVRVVASGHSVDVVPTTTTKFAVVERIRHREGPVDVLTVGDQGQIGGNDFELLAHEPWSLSVDRASADPTRCWYLGDGAVAGPALLVRYIKALRRRRGGAGVEMSTLR